MAPVPGKKKTPVAGVPFLDMSTYVEGGQSFDIPEGDYAIQWRVDNERYADGTVPVGSRLTCYPLRGGDPVVKFITFGKGMEDSWMPGDDGLTVVETPQDDPDFVRKAFSKKGNWAILLKSLYDCAPDVPNLSDSFEPVDGLWATIQNIPEPAERASFGQSTAEAAEKKKFLNKIPVITAIVEGGKPWEGGGGFDFLETKATPKKKPAFAPAGVKPKVKPAPEPEPEEVTEPEDDNEVEDASTVASAAVAAVLAKNKNGLSSALLQTQVFPAVKKDHGAEMAQAVMGILKGDSYEAILGAHGYKLAGTQIKKS